MVDVTRLEWSIKCYEARFAQMRYLSEYTFEGFMKLLNNVTLKWGRLCIPQSEDTNRSRWPPAPLWVELRRLIDDWSWNYDGIARRVHERSADMSYSYKKNFLGHLAGLQARVSLAKGKKGPVSVNEALDYLREQGDMTSEGMFRKAYKKLQVLSRLAKSPLGERGKNNHDDRDE